jgi:phosphatidylglycerol:prolipoprotein diacylglycerol transferase
MCSELFRIPHQWHGVPIFGFGLLLAIWAVATAATLVALVRRQGWTSELFGALPMLLLVGAAIVFLPRVFPEGLPVRGYGVMLLLAIVTGVGMAMHRARQGGLNPDIILSLAFWMVITGVIGARLFYVIEYWDEKFAGRTARDTILAILNIPEGGLVVFGGLIGAAVGFVAFVRKQKLPLLAMADVVAPCMAIGLALGRIGCLLNGCCYGGPSDLPWAITFPKYSSPLDADQPAAARRFSPPYSDQASSGTFFGFRLESRDAQPVVVAQVDTGSPAATAGLKVGDVLVAVNGIPFQSPTEAKALIFNAVVSSAPLELRLADQRTIDLPTIPLPERSRPVHPTQLYSAIDAGLLGWLLWAYFPLRRRDGECIALLLTIHPITRFLLEIIRTDEAAVFNTGLSISQNVSILLLAAGLALWWYLSRQSRGTTWPLVAAAHSSAPASNAGRDGVDAGRATAGSRSNGMKPGKKTGKNRGARNA